MRTAGSCNTHCERYRANHLSTIACIRSHGCAGLFSASVGRVVTCENTSSHTHVGQAHNNWCTYVRALQLHMYLTLVGRLYSRRLRHQLPRAGAPYAYAIPERKAARLFWLAA